MAERFLVAVYDSRGRYKGTVAATGAELARARQQQAIAAEQNKRFRNAPTTGVKIAAELGSMALTMGTGTGIIGPFVSALLRDLLMRQPDFTVGKTKSPTRAMPGLPFSGTVNSRTGVVTRPKSVAEIVAATKKAVAAAVTSPAVKAAVTAAAKPGAWAVPWASPGKGGSAGAGGNAGGGGPSSLGGQGGNRAGSNRGNKHN